MDDFMLFVCGVVVTLIAGMGVITSQVFMGYSEHVTKPTAVIVIELTRKGKIPPRNIPPKTNGSFIARTKLSSLLLIFSM